MLDIATLLLVLSVCSLLVATLVMIALALRKTRAQRRSAAQIRWRPPLGSGSTLALWGARVSELVTREILARGGSKATSRELAQEVLSGASLAVQYLPQVIKDVDFADCRDRSFGRIGVTPPEILAIADEIRRDPHVARQIHDRAARNAELLAGHVADELLEELECPLRNSHGSCAVPHLCPLQCRTSCALTQGLDPEDATAVQKAASDLRFGIEVGVSRGLKAGGLDGHVYELNSALATALETGRASEKWASGEFVLERCMRDDYSSYAI